MRIYCLLALMALSLFLGFFPPQVAQATDPVTATNTLCMTNPSVELAPAQPKMYEFVKYTNPRLADSDVLYVAKVLQEKATEYGLDLITFAAIIAQESSFRLGVTQGNCNLNSPDNCDRGLGQISSFWVKKWSLDHNRLRYDVAYNLDVAARILKSVLDAHPDETKAYSRYYHPGSSQRKTYEKLIETRIKLASR
jgi:soluble lytic murein transglycosylase-like protein